MKAKGISGKTKDEIISEFDKIVLDGYTSFIAFIFLFIQHGIDGIKSFLPKKEIVVFNTSSSGGMYENIVLSSKIQIYVRAKSSGIPQKIKNKIFQPFFTTKPMSSGTGPGLSLSCDIIKAHGGMITVESAKNNGTEFIIHLPNHSFL